MRRREVIAGMLAAMGGGAVGCRDAGLAQGQPNAR